MADSTRQDWEERFDETFMRDDGLLAIGKYDQDEVKAFIRQELEREREETIKEIIDKHDAMHSEWGTQQLSKAPTLGWYVNKLNEFRRYLIDLTKQDGE